MHEKTETDIWKFLAQFAGEMLVRRMEVEFFSYLDWIWRN